MARPVLGRAVNTVKPWGLPPRYFTGGFPDSIERYRRACDGRL